jgi:hypothetical protein
MAGSNIFATDEQEQHFLETYADIVDGEFALANVMAGRGKDSELYPDRLISPLTGMDISRNSTFKDEEDEEAEETITAAAGGLVGGRGFMDDYNRIMRHRVG